MKPATNNKEMIFNHFRKRWVCRVFQSTFFDRPACSPEFPHEKAFGCDYRYEASLTTDQMFTFIEILNRLEDKKDKKDKQVKQVKQVKQD